MPPRFTVSLNPPASSPGPARGGQPARVRVPQGEPGNPDTLFRRFRKAAREFLYGMTTYEMVLYARGRHGRLEAIFFLITMGDFLGLPVLPPYYSLRLLPHVIPRMESWKRLVLRERDITDAMSGG